MDSATTRNSWLDSVVERMPAATASPKATKANSPPGASRKPERAAATRLRPKTGPTAVITSALPAISIAIPARMVCHFATKRLKEISIPTVMKNSPSRRPRYGAMSLSTCRANSVSARSSPARKAPRAIDRPATCVRREVPTQVSRVVAAKISAFENAAIFLNSGRRRARPAEMMIAMHTTALTAAIPRAVPISAMLTCPPPGLGASSGISIRRATTAKSCSSSTEKVARPCRLPLSPRSCSTCRATAVEERAMAPPRMTAAEPPSPSNMATPAIAAVLTRNWALPRPKTYLRMLWRRSRLSSRPILNRRNTTPNSATCCTAWTSLTSPRACGPMRAPPARKPRTGLPPGSLQIAGTAMTLVTSSTSISTTPLSMCRSSGARLRINSGVLSARVCRGPASLAARPLRRFSISTWLMRAASSARPAAPPMMYHLFSVIFCFISGMSCSGSPGPVLEEKNEAAKNLEDLATLDFSTFLGIRSSPIRSSSEMDRNTRSSISWADLSGSSSSSSVSWLGASILRESVASTEAPAGAVATEPSASAFAALAASLALAFLALACSLALASASSRRCFTSCCS
mmetsp:Transcript_5667/g.15870  ORF Transcript_5667/g.15870 Transcript_5667/m.15870 type:complete len:576 (-) Transcript_5667:1185-2912(-)